MTLLSNYGRLAPICMQKTVAFSTAKDIKKMKIFERMNFRHYASGS